MNQPDPTETTAQYVFRVSEIRDGDLKRNHGYFASLSGAHAYCETQERKPTTVPTARFELFPDPGGDQWLLHIYAGPEDDWPDVSDLVISRHEVAPDQAAPAAVPPPDPTTDRRDRWRHAARDIARRDWADEVRCAPLDDGEFEQDATDLMAVADAEQTELRRERDLAIAHDRQPYPTAWAYEQACKALRRKTEAIERVRAYLASQTDALPQGYPTAVPAADVLAALDEPTGAGLPAVPSAPTSRAALLLWAADELGRMDYDTDSNDYGYDTFRDAWNGGVMDGAGLLRGLAAEERDEQEAQANLDQLAEDLAAAVASCPGAELSPSQCRCPCYGCKHHCGAHDPSGLADDVAAVPAAEEQPENETPEGRDHAVLARVSEWVTSEVVTARSEFGNGYREAQRDIRDLLGGAPLSAVDAPPAVVPQPEEACACGKTVGLGEITYQPCARPTDHPEAYCRSADGNHMFLAAPTEEQPS